MYQEKAQGTRIRVQGLKIRGGAQNRHKKQEVGNTKIPANWGLRFAFLGSPEN